MSGSDLHRSAEIAKIRIGQKKLGIDDETYRDLLANLTGHRSTRDLDMRQRHKMLAHFEQLGAYADQVKVKRSRDPQARLIHALWKELGATGKLRTPTKAALRAYCARMLHPGQENIEVDPDHLTMDQGRVIIEGLKSWVKRAA